MLSMEATHSDAKGLRPLSVREGAIPRQRVRPRRRHVYHTYATTARGGEFLMGYYGILDRAPKGRREYDASEFWIRRHDEYDQD
jgi:predicted dithiol-disulfide oxidoreductase (DUF899 family)